jgi:low temperature requirement protein LtrA
MWANLPVTQRAPRFILILDVIDSLLLLVAILKAARGAMIAFMVAVAITTGLFLASLSAARNYELDRLKLFVQIAAVLSVVASLTFLAAR